MEIFMLALTAILLENFIFVKFLGCCPFLGLSDNPSTAVGMGCAVTFVMTLACAATNLVYQFFLVSYHLEYLKTIAFILIIAALVQLIEMFLRRYVPSLYAALGIYLPLITTNCAILGCAILCIQKDYDFIHSVLYGFFSAIGFTMAIVIFAGVRARVALANPPKAFKGIPIALVTAGLIAMAFSGFQGVTIA